ncbi:MarR family transcriptional regulator [Streptomyces sp. SUK 48]|uniref:MarR family winged helix-turn-helix transcriptional regulator n=1 Tax=Streptomyces sp. SUK 48 TaxID=2582831 RepID=UPI0018916147|nr:MarR family transcriptional regulator [Streptomyces sp. SUK 48]
MERRVDPTESEGRAALDGLYTALSALAYTMTGNRAHSRLRREAGVSVDRASLAVLRVLAASPEPLRMGELAKALLVNAPHVTREVRRLEDSGLVATTREPGDQRARRARATGEGREAVARAEATGKRWLGEALGEFSPEELETAAAVINRIVAVLRP